jgi:hypothetical protein
VRWLPILILLLSASLLASPLGTVGAEVPRQVGVYMVTRSDATVDIQRADIVSVLRDEQLLGEATVTKVDAATLVINLKGVYEVRKGDSVVFTRRPVSKRPTRTTATSSRPANLSLSSLSNQLRVKLERWGPEHPTAQIRGYPVEEGPLQRYLGIFSREFSLYSESVVSGAGVDRVVFCSALSYGGQTRNAIPDYTSRTLFLKVPTVSEPLDYYAWLLHHEFFHFIDYADDRSITLDPKWSRLNEKSFRYGGGGHLFRDASASIKNYPAPGFFNRYGMSAIEEDKAEVFAYLMTDWDGFHKGADHLLREKAELLQQQLLRHNSLLGPRFWSGVRAGQSRAW